MKNSIFWDIITCGSLITDVSEECIFAIISVTGIGELETTLPVTSYRSALRSNVGSYMSHTASPRRRLHYSYTVPDFWRHSLGCFPAVSRRESNETGIHGTT
jgi:hypothetical protein